MHAYHTLSAEELRNVLMGHASDLVERLPVDALSDAEAMAAILRITDGNFRLVVRLLTQAVKSLKSTL